MYCPSFPQYGSPPPSPAPEIRPSCIRQTRRGPCCAPRSQAGQSTHTLLGTLTVAMLVAPPGEAPRVSHAPPIILPGFRAHISHSWVAHLSFIVMTEKCIGYQCKVYTEYSSRKITYSYMIDGPHRPQKISSDKGRSSSTMESISSTPWEKIIVHNINLQHISLWEYRIKALRGLCFFRIKLSKKVDILIFIHSNNTWLVQQSCKTRSSAIWRLVCKARPKTFWARASEFCFGSCRL